MSLQTTLKPILHIATDEKFIDAAHDIYEKAFPEANCFVILSDKKNEEIQHLSRDRNYQIINISNRSFDELTELANKALIVVFHSLTVYMAKIAINIGGGTIKVWSVFGSEVYNNPYIFSKEIYGSYTYKEFIQWSEKSIKDILRPYYYKIVKREIDPNKLVLKAMAQMDLIGILYEEEYRLYKERSILNSNTEHLKFTYYPIGIIINEDQTTVSSDNILLGNSASETNNHLEVFYHLSEMNIGERKIITPLSYGSKEYADQIISFGNKLIGKKFSPLTEFLPLPTYQNIMQSCGIVIMNHYRQQAVGNVLTALYMGAKVYLSNRNTLYHYLKRIGCHISCIEEDLEPKNAEAFSLLSKPQMLKNRKLLRRELSLKRVCEELNQKLNSYLA